MMFQISSCHLTPHLPEPQVPPLPPQVTSPHPHCELHETSPHCVPWSQVTSPQHLHHPHLTPPHLPHPHVTSPHLPHPHVTSPQFPHPHVTSAHPPHPRVTSPHPHVTSPHLPHPQFNSPQHPHPYFTSPHVTPQPQHQFSNRNPDPGLNAPTWVKAEPTSELSYLQRSYSCSQQDQNQFSAGVSQTRCELEHTQGLPYNSQSLFTCGTYDQGVSPDPLQDTWGSLGPTLSQLECSSLDSLSTEDILGRWSSSSAEDSTRTQFVHNGYHDSSAPQPFCSPNTPGPSPHYPHTPTMSSPGTPMHPLEERQHFPTQTSRQPSSCLQDSNSYSLAPEPGSRQMSQNVLPGHSEQVQDHLEFLHTPAGHSESCFPAKGGSRDVSSVAQPSGSLAGLSWRDECGGGRGGAGGGNNVPDWTWMKQPPPTNSTKALDCRMLCVVCKREFRSLPALNGHMRSHNGSRSATWLNKVEDSSLPAPRSVTMVMPVTVPIRPKGTVKSCRNGRGGCGRVSVAVGHAVLYCSLLHQEEEAVAKDNVDVSSRGNGEVTVSDAVTRGDGASHAHYTPPPMLCPVRSGPGLYCSLLTRRQQWVQTVQLHNTHNGLSDPVAMETASTPCTTLTTGAIKPRINVGRAFQAEVPPLQEGKKALSNPHNALLLWTPRDELEHPVNQHRVEALLTMARSSVVPEGGASPEFALRVLSECEGDFLLTVEKLLSPPETSNTSCTAQQYPSVRWSTTERSSLVKSVQLHHKDFSRIQKAVQTKSLSQCVEFYYLWKKKLNLSARTPAGLTITLPDLNGQRLSKTT